MNIKNTNKILKINNCCYVRKKVYLCKKRIGTTSNKKTDKMETSIESNTTTAKRLTVKDWSSEDQPREKLIAKGKKELSTAELIAILLGSGNVEQNAVELAKEVLRSYNDDLSLLSRQGVSDLIKGHKGIGEAKAVTIIAALELGYRMLTEQNKRKEYYCNDSSETFKYISSALIDLPYEEFWAIYLNTRNKVLFKKRISVGGINETPVDIRRIFSTALEWNAVSIAVAHNHPTGSVSPSTKDIQLTNTIAEAGRILNIKLKDHLIVGITEENRSDYYSFHDNGRL